MEEHRIAPKTLSFPGRPQSASWLRCPSILLRVLALVPVTDCKWREVRRMQPPKLPHPAPQRAPAVASREIWGRAPHLYPKRVPMVQPAAPTCPKTCYPGPDLPFWHSHGLPHAAHHGYGEGPPILSCPPISGLPSPHPNLSCRNKHLQAGKQLDGAGGPREGEGCLFAEGTGLFSPQI